MKPDAIELFCRAVGLTVLVGLVLFAFVGIALHVHRGRVARRLEEAQADATREEDVADHVAFVAAPTVGLNP